MWERSSPGEAAMQALRSGRHSWGDPIAASPGLDSSHGLIRYAVATAICRDALKNRNNASSGNALPTSITPSQPPCS